MEGTVEARMDQTESAPEYIEATEPKKMVPKGRGKGRGGRGYARGKMQGRALYGFGPVRGFGRRGMGRMHPYPDVRGGRGIHGRPIFPHAPPTRGMMRMPFLPSPPRYGIPPPSPPPPLPPPPPEFIGFGGRPPFPPARGMPPWPRGPFPPPRRFSNGPRAPAPPPPGRGQRWPGPPGGIYC